MSNLNQEKYRKCRMCLKGLQEKDKSLFDDENFLLLRFQKCFNARNIHNFLNDNMRHLACLCESCAERLCKYIEFGHKARKNLRQFKEGNKDFLKNKCLICLVPHDHKNQNARSIFEDEYQLAIKFGKSFGIKYVHSLQEHKGSDKICESCCHKLDEFTCLREFVRECDKEVFGNPFYDK